MNDWRAYYPEDGQTADDAVVVRPRSQWAPKIMDAEDAAKRACEMDFTERDGWERSRDTEFPIIIIAPDGTETEWACAHEPSINHTAREKTD